MFLIIALLLMRAGSAQAAILYLEDFDPNPSNWVTRDGEMTVSHDPGNFMVGSFGASFLPQSDAFRIASGNFIGDYTSGTMDHPLTQISFDLVAVNVLPSDLFIRIIGGANTFTYQFSPISMSATYVVNLAWSFGWSGLSESAFNAALASVDALEIQIGRSGSLAQNYYLDNVQTLNTDIGGGGGGDTVIPEPTTVSMFVFALGFLFGMRRFANHGSSRA
jgi:hypothetical protein